MFSAPRPCAGTARSSGTPSRCRAGLGARVRDIAPADRDPARGHGLEARDHAQRRGLAAARLAEQDDELARVRDEVDVLDDGDLAEALGRRRRVPALPSSLASVVLPAGSVPASRPSRSAPARCRECRVGPPDRLVGVERSGRPLPAHESARRAAATTRRWSPPSSAARRRRRGPTRSRRRRRPRRASRATCAVRSKHTRHRRHVVVVAAQGRRRGAALAAARRSRAPTARARRDHGPAEPGVDLGARGRGAAAIDQASATPGSPGSRRSASARCACHQRLSSSSRGQSWPGVTLQNRAQSTPSGSSTPQASTISRACQATGAAMPWPVAPDSGASHQSSMGSGSRHGCRAGCGRAKC